MTTYGFVGDLLLRSGVVDADGLTRAIEAQAGQSATLGRVLADLGLADEATVARQIATAMRLEYMDGDTGPADSETSGLLPADFCRKRRIAPLGVEANRIRLAVADPMDYSVLQDVEFRTGRKAVAVIATQTWLDQRLASIYPEDPVPAIDRLDAEPVAEVEIAGEHEGELVDVAALVKDVNLPPIVRLVNLILSDAAKAGASDVHIEPHESLLQVRQRVDGLLHDVLTIPHHLQDATISRLKIMSGMDIAERRKPQDGRSRLRFDGRRIDLRVSTMPTQFGEKIVIRLLNADKADPADRSARAVAGEPRA